jgi:hypothetical protein
MSKFRIVENGLGEFEIEYYTISLFSGDHFWGTFNGLVYNTFDEAKEAYDHIVKKYKLSQEKDDLRKVKKVVYKE